MSVKKQELVLWSDLQKRIKEIQKIDPNFSIEYTNKPTIGRMLLKYKSITHANIDVKNNFFEGSFYLSGILLGLEKERNKR